MGHGRSGNPGLVILTPREMKARNAAVHAGDSASGGTVGGHGWPVQPASARYVVERYDKRIGAWAFDSYHADRAGVKVAMNRVRGLGERPRHRSLLHLREKQAPPVAKPAQAASAVAGPPSVPHRFVFAGGLGGAAVSTRGHGPSTERVGARDSVSRLQVELRNLRISLGMPAAAMPSSEAKLRELIARAQECLARLRGA